MSDDKRKIQIAEMAQVMSSESGRNVMRRIINATGVDEDTFDVDTHKHAYKAGCRSVGLAIKEEIEDCDIDGYNLMMRSKD